MAPKPLSILVLSSCGPEHFAGFGHDVIQALEQNGHTVDYLTRYQSDHPRVVGLYPAPKRPLTQRIRQRYPFLSFLRPILQRLKPEKAPVIPYIHKNGLAIVSPDESKPPIDTALILSAIKPVYDLVIVHVWQDMLTSKTLQAIDTALHIPIILLAGDMQPMTGGCYYFGDCTNFMHGCGTCPIIDSTDPRDFTHTNHVFKQRVYASINCAFVGNTYMNRFASQSGLFSEDRIKPGAYVLDKNEYLPLDATASRQALGLPKDKKYILFSRYAGNHQTVKGYSYLIASINRLAEKLDASQKTQTLLVLAGTVDREFERRFNLDVLSVGYLSRDQLIKAYSASTLFISSSIDDAGPSMVNQSLMCGTPVVAFEIGTAIDAVTNGLTGYKAPLKDTDAFCEGIHRIINLSDTDYQTMRTHCRSFAEEQYTFAAFATNIETIYQQLKGNVEMHSINHENINL